MLPFTGGKTVTKIMILGAGIYQVPLIETAKKMGLYTIVVSIPGNYPGFALADKVYYENTVDEDKILEIAKKGAHQGNCHSRNRRLHENCRQGLRCHGTQRPFL